MLQEIKVIISILGFLFGLYMLIQSYRASKKVDEIEAKVERMSGRNPETKLSSRQRRKVALSSIYSRVLGAYTNDIYTGLSDDCVRELLAGYEIYGPDNQLKRQIEEMIAFFLSGDALRQASYGPEYLKLIRTFELIDEDADVENIDVSAWAISVAIMLARFGVDLKVWAKSEAMVYIDQAYELAVQRYESWEDYGIAHNIGGMKWAGDEAIFILENERKFLTESSESIWGNCAFK